MAGLNHKNQIHPANERRQRSEGSGTGRAGRAGREVLVAMSEDTKDGFGLDKEQRLLAKRLGKEEEEAAQAASLEPPFPFVMTQFDAGFFDL